MSTENQDGKTSTVEDKLKAAVAASNTETVEETVEEDLVEEEVVEEGKPKGKSEVRIPKKRFDEVNTKFKEASASNDLLTQQVADSNAKLIEMAELLAAKDTDVNTLNEIKSFVNDPSMEAHVRAIDAKLKGIEQEVETGESTPDEAQAKTRELIEQTRTEMADIQATASAEALVGRADVIADKLLAQLPDTYNEQDRTIVQALWTEKMDWDQAVANPDDLSAQLTDGFQEALDTYGTPRGALFTVEEVEELTPEGTTVKTPEEELAALMDQNWGSVKTETSEGGKTTVTAEKSDDEFNDAMAAIIRKANNR
jgi:hypothetical protein